MLKEKSSEHSEGRTEELKAVLSALKLHISIFSVKKKKTIDDVHMQKFVLI